jgi:hypothetical protein
MKNSPSHKTGGRKEHQILSFQIYTKAQVTARVIWSQITFFDKMGM